MKVSESDAAGRADAPAPAVSDSPLVKVAAARDRLVEADIAFSKVNLNAFDDFSSYMKAENEARQVVAAARAEYDEARSAIRADPKLAEQQHRQTQEAIRSAIGAARRFPLTLDASDDDLAGHQAATKAAYAMQAMWEDSFYDLAESVGKRSLWGDPAYRWADEGDLDSTYEVLGSYDRARSYVFANRRSPNSRATWQKAFDACRQGQFGEGYGMPCASCTRPMSSYDDERYGCGGCDG